MTSTVPDGAAAQALLVAALGGSGWINGCDLGPTVAPSLARQVTTPGAVWCAGEQIGVADQIAPAAETDATRSRWVVWHVTSVGQVVPLLGPPSLAAVPDFPELDPSVAYLGADLLAPTTTQLRGAPQLDLRIPLRPVSMAATPPTVIPSTPSPTVNVNDDVSSYDITVTRNIGLHLTATAPLTGRELLIMLRQDATGTWALSGVTSAVGSVLWLGGNPPSLLTGNGARTKITLTWDGGAWLGEWANYL